MAIKIFIDQGHNPSNPNAGAEGNGLREQDIVFRIGILLAELFRENPAFEVKLSRPTLDVQLGTSNTTSLRERVRLANEWGADYFLSLHTNASSIPSATGVEAFAYSKPSDAFDLGADIISGISELTGLRNRGMKVRSGLYVLRKTSMPAVLIELGFITNPNDARLMVDEPELFAQGIYNGSLEFFGLN
jgi:N-acetylmuramoyl-L-alanine amidase